MHVSPPLSFFRVYARVWHLVSAQQMFVELLNDLSLCDPLTVSMLKGREGPRSHIRKGQVLTVVEEMQTCDKIV